MHMDSDLEEQEVRGLQSPFCFSSSKNLRPVTVVGVWGLAYSHLLPSSVCICQLPPPADGLFEVTFKWLRAGWFTTVPRGKKSVASGVEFLARSLRWETPWAPDPALRKAVGLSRLLSPQMPVCQHSGFLALKRS